ncbi:MAG: GGDEF domain-containing protein [Roseburia faecis]
MSAATLCVGLGCNFQLCLFGVILFFFIIECILPDKKKSITPVLILSSLYSVAIVALYVAGNRISPFYPLSLAETGTMAVVIVIFVLLLIITSMLFLLRYMVHEEEKLTKKAEYDALTGIPNRFFMMDEIQKLFIENGQKDYYLAMIDIDNFKNINDTYGHNTGDDALKILAKTIILQAQKHGFKYCRWGGEEFLLLGKCRSCEIPKDILEELRSAISSNCVRTSRESFRYTVTIGAGKYTSGQSAKEWLDFVDKQLYKGKRSGKNQVVCS